jgi:nitrous oxide reductase accessory protein NosL
MKRTLLFFSLLCLTPLLGAGCQKEAAAPQEATAVPAKKALGADGQMHLDAEDHCPVCGMTVGPERKFASAMQLKDGTTYHFCGTGCMLKGWLHPEVFLGKDRAQVKRAVTPEYFEGAYIDAGAAWWVAGSDVRGPMGAVIVPLKSEDDVKTFQQRHGGGEVFRLKELDDARWKSITGKAAQPPHKSH